MARARNPHPPLIFLAPSIFGTAVFVVLPFVDVVRRSFLADTGSTFAGLDNYRAVIESSAAQLAAINTLGFLGIGVPLLLVCSLAAALLLQKTTPVRSLMKSALLIPLALPVFGIALAVSFLFAPEGLVNDVLLSLNLAPHQWLEGPEALFVMLGLFLWKNLGFATILWLAALGRIPASCQEAARLDGASPWQRLRYLTLPLVAPAAAFLAVFSVGNGFKIYREAYLLAGSYPSDSLYLIPHLFAHWFTNLSFGKLAAATVLLTASLLVVFALVVGATAVIRQGGDHR
ncbi:carbohydrate ABC transporter permease [uncultured Adlercreutzia sp.]|uniref:carbohydrate ABC transporter permease n=1 Tax=uncultured Adlercreutzia sp. TaxID=875803 RepID=UPI0026F38964|nr:sugar ABC transporter permease [uncultured Adlercreutzia sp.]